MKRERAYVEGRRHQVLEMLQRNPQVRVDELAKRLGVSVVTLRRDLQFLEEKSRSEDFTEVRAYLKTLTDIWMMWLFTGI